MGLFLGSSIGSYLPTFLGQDLFSGWSVILGALGGFAGIYVGYKLSDL